MTGRDRQVPTLREPPADPSALAGFPRSRLPAGTRLWRVVRPGNGPWWFSSSMAGRFDLAVPGGTCYLATDALTAVLELVGPELAGGAVATGTLDKRRLRELEAPGDRSLADPTARRASAWVTAEIHDLVPYGLPQRWAAALAAAGAEGVRYFVRHDPSRAAYGVALFGEAGERRGWPRGRERPIGAALRRRLAEECAIAVLDRPVAAALTVEDAD